MAKIYIEGLGYVDDPNAPPEMPGMPPAPTGPMNPYAAPAQVASAPAKTGRGDGQYTPEERAWLYQNMPGINAGEADIAEKQALSAELRRTPRQRMDWASQAERGLAGVGDALAADKMKKGRADVTAKYGRLGSGWPGQGGGGSDFYKRNDEDDFMMGR